MLHKIALSEKYGNNHISILYPGIFLDGKDSGIGSIGRIDQANIQGGTTIKMHPHINDEILSYFRLGKAVYIHSAGLSETICRFRLIPMKTRSEFHQEENFKLG